jgi:signal transduction histidine kinase
MRHKDEPNAEKIIKAAGLIEEIVGFVLQTEASEYGIRQDNKPVLISEVFEQLKFLFEDKAARKNVELFFESSSEKLVVIGDRTMITHQILGNLISNAIKYSFAGSKVVIKAEPSGKGNVNITVEDHGVGMNQNVIKNLFSKSKNASMAGTKNEEGHGFGLSIARSCVVSCGGKINIESRTIEEDKNNSGSKFVISLPSNFG